MHRTSTEVELILLRGHLEACVSDVAHTGSKAAQARSIEGIIAALARIAH
jgi:hypothetical protein